MEATKAEGLNDQLAEALKQLNLKEAERSRFEVALVQARTWLAEARERRAKFVKELAGAADDAERGFVELEIDEADREVISHERFIESHTLMLTEIVTARNTLLAEYEMLNAQVEAAKKAVALEAWQREIEQAFNTASDALDRARTSLGELVIAARKGADAFGHPAHAWLTQLNEGLFGKQGNLDVRGFVDRYDYNPSQFTFVIKPQVRRKDLQ